MKEKLPFFMFWVFGKPNYRTNLVQKLLLVLYLFFGGSNLMQAQLLQPQWLNTVLNTGGVESYSIDVDASGNVYLLGQFLSSTDFDPGPGTATVVFEPSYYNVTIAKYDPSGNYIWAKSLGKKVGGADSYIKGESIKVNSAGEIYIAGWFDGTIDFDPSTATTDTVHRTSAGSYDMYLEKLDANGNLLWINQMGDLSNDRVNQMVLDPSEKPCITGQFARNVDFNPQGAPVVVSSAAFGAEVFLAKYNADGTLDWAKNTVSNINNNTGYGIDCDVTGNLYLTGGYQATADFDPSGATANLTSNGQSDVFVAKYDQNGNYIWAETIGSTRADDGYQVSVDGLGNVYALGTFSDSIDVDPSAGVDMRYAVGFYDYFLVKYDAAGSQQWTQTWGTTNYDQVYDLATNSSNEVIVVAGFDGALDVDPSAGTENYASPSGFYNTVISKYDGSGNHIQTNFFTGSSNSNVSIQEIHVDAADEIYITGNFYGNFMGGAVVDFDPSAGTLDSTGVNSSSDIFFGKYAPPCVTDQSVSVSNGTINCPGSESVILGSSEVGVDYFLRNNVNNAVVSGPVAGTGGSISLNTGIVDSNSTYQVFAQNNGGANYALTFDGVNDRVAITNSSDITGTGTANWTVEAWIKSDGTNARKSIFTWGDSSNTTNTGAWFFINPSNQLQFDLNASGGPSSAAIVADGTWHHVAVTNTANTIQLYVDGVADGSQVKLVNIGPGLAFIGSGWSYTNGFAPYLGEIDQLGYYSRALTSGEVLAMSSTCRVGNETSLEALYDFDNGAGSLIISDVTGRGHEGTLTFMDENTAYVSGTTACPSGCDHIMAQTATINFVNNPPVFTYCPNDTTIYGPISGCQAVVNWTPPVATDECVTPILTSNISPGATLPVGVTTVTYTASDSIDPASIVTQEIIIQDNAGPNLRLLDMDGTNAISAASSGSCFSVVVDRNTGKVYRMVGSDIIESNVDGSNAVNIITGLNTPSELEIDPTAGYIFWTEYTGRRVMRADLDGTNQLVIKSNLPSGARHFGLGLDKTNQKVYWEDHSGVSMATLWEANYDGTGLTMIGPAIFGITDVCPAHGRLYFTVNSSTNTGSIGYRDLTTLATVTLVSNTNARTMFVSEDGEKLVWYDQVVDEIITADTNGTNLTTIATGITSAINIGKAIGTPPTASTNVLKTTCSFNITVLDTVNHTLDQTVVQCDSAQVLGTWYYSTQMIADTLFGGATNGCDSIVNTDLTINSIANETVMVNRTNLACSDLDTVTIASSAVGVNYFLRDNTNDTIVDGPVAGTGSGLAFETGMINQNMSYNVQAEISSLGGGGLLFDGTDDRVDMGDNFNREFNEPVSIEAWIRLGFDPTAIGGVYLIYSKMTPSFQQGMQLYVHDGRLRAQFTNNYGVNYFDAFTGQIIGTPNQWYHVAMTYSGTPNNSNEVKFYLDGVQQVTSTIGNNLGSSILVSESAFIGGNNTGTSPLNGELSDVRIWDDVRTAAEITSNMNACLLGTEPNLIGYYKFEDGTGSSTLTDASPSGVDGTLISMDNANAWTAGKGNCNSTLCSREMTDVVSITLESTGLISNNPTSTIVCENDPVSFVLNTSGVLDSLVWYVSTDAGGSWNSIGLPSVSYSGTQDSLSIDTALPSFDNYQFRSVAYKCGNSVDTSLSATLIVNSLGRDTIGLIVCDSANVNGTWYFTTQTIVDTLAGASANGCDSIATTNLTINYTQTGTDAITSCDSVLVNGNTYYSSQVVMDTLAGASANGCDSIVTTTLTINYAQTGTDAIISCDSALVNGTMYYSSQVVVDTLASASANGCDSIVTTTLTINYTQTGTDAIISCDSALVNGTMYYSSQVVMDTLAGASANGCDSIVTTTLTINYTQTGTDAIISCDSALVNGMMYYSSQVVIDTLAGASANSCDSIVTTTLTINYTQTGTDAIISCDSALVNGTMYYSSQVVVDTLAGASANGCDSVVTTTLTINYTQTGTDAIISCDSALVNGMMYYSTQVVVDTLAGASANGCDSVVTTTLTINYTQTGTDAITSCDSALVNSMMYYSSQVIVDTLAGASANGCDSIVTTTLTINSTQTFSKTDSICTGDSVLLGGSFQTQSGIYYDTLTGAASTGCDSIIISTLVVKNLPNVVANASNDTLCLGDSTILFGSGDAISYVWNNGVTDSVEFSPTLGTTTYTVVGTGANSCQNSDSIAVFVAPSAVAPTGAPNSYSYCESDVIASIDVMAGSGNIVWYSDVALSNSIHTGNSFMPTFNFGTTTLYLVEELGSCVSSTVVLTINFNEDPIVDAGQGITFDANAVAQLDGTVSGAISHTWYPIDLVSDSTILNPDVLATEPTNFYLAAVSDSGCTAIDSAMIELNQVITNFTSPNGDGQNDTWEIRPVSTVQGCLISIFDGLGNVIYQTTDYNNEWDGTNSDGESMPDGVYYYSIKCGEAAPITGSITLVR